MLTISGINLIGQLYQFRPHRDRQVRDHVFIIDNQVNPNRHRILTIGQLGLKGAIKLTRNKIPIWGFSNGIVPAVTTLRMGYPSVLLIIPTLLADDQALRRTGDVMRLKVKVYLFAILPQFVR